MGLLDSKVYRAMEFITTFCILNVIWLLACLPIVTIFPATTAMFSVIRDWKSEKKDSVIKNFIHAFRMHFKQSFLIGLAWTMIAILLLADFMFTNQLQNNMKYPLFFLFFFLTLVFLLGTVTIFPILVRFQGKALELVIYTCKVSIKFLPHSFLSIVVLSLSLVVCFSYPGLSLILFSVTAFIMYSISNRYIEKIQLVS